MADLEGFHWFPLKPPLCLIPQYTSGTISGRNGTGSLSCMESPSCIGHLISYLNYMPSLCLQGHAKIKKSLDLFLEPKGGSGSLTISVG